jgi:hypothetical protein
MAKEEIEQIEERNKQNAMKRQASDAARGHNIRLKSVLSGKEITPPKPEHKSTQDYSKAIGRESRKMEESSAYGRISSRFKALSGRSLDAAAKEHGDEAKRLQKEIEAQQAEIDRRKAAMGKEKQEEACWIGYKQIGLKKKGNRMVPNCVKETSEELGEDLRKWFKQKWVRMDTKGNIKGDCAREPGEGKPKCLPQAKAHALGKEKRAAAAQRKRREDPDPDRRGKPINVRTEEVEQIDEMEKKEYSKSARIIKSIYKRKHMYDFEKGDKQQSQDDNVGDDRKRPKAKAVMTGGKTMTGQQRDDVEIDPQLARKPDTPDGFEKGYGKKSV